MKFHSHNKAFPSWIAFALYPPRKFIVAEAWDKETFQQLNDMSAGPPKPFPQVCVHLNKAQVDRIIAELQRLREKLP